MTFEIEPFMEDDNGRLVTWYRLYDTTNGPRVLLMSRINWVALQYEMPSILWTELHSQ